MGTLVFWIFSTNCTQTLISATAPTASAQGLSEDCVSPRAATRRRLEAGMCSNLFFLAFADTFSRCRSVHSFGHPECSRVLQAAPSSLEVALVDLDVEDAELFGAGEVGVAVGVFGDFELTLP